MSGRIDAERILDAFLAPESDRLPDRVIDAALSDIARTPQRRALRVPWRFTQMTNSMRAAAAVAIVAIVGVGVLAFNSRSPGFGGETPNPTVAPTGSASPTTSPAPAASPTPGPTVLPPLDTTGWLPYTSERYGFSLAYPAAGAVPTSVEWEAVPGDHDWTFETDIDVFNSTGPDNFHTQGVRDGLGIAVSVWTDTLDPGTTPADWIDAYCAAPLVAGSCSEAKDLLPEVMPPGVTRILGWTKAGEPMAAFSVGETVYVLAIFRQDHDPSVRPWGGSQRLLEGFLRTMRLPE